MSSESHFGISGATGTETRFPVPIRGWTPSHPDKFVKRVKEALSASGVECSRYSGHSFRNGAASVAASRGVPDATIKTLGRWESSAYLLYIKLPREHLANISEMISNSK